jgi:4-amino-4-deoxy-L-arabinose transferase-like glycosyltransferase
MSKPFSNLDRWRICLFTIVAAYGVLLTVELSANSMLWDEVTHFHGGLLLSRGQVGTWVWTNSLYPPIYDLFTAAYYLIAGPSVFAGRLVAVTFSVLSVIVIYELTSRLYNKKTALLSAALFAVMPGIVWLSRLAMIETLLIFVFSLCLLYFFSWISNGRERDRKIGIVLFAVGVAVKYQTIVVVPLIMLLAMFFWKRSYVKDELRRCLKLPRIAIIVAAAVMVAAIFLVLLVSGILDVLFFAVKVGTEQKAVFSARYPLPVFYLIEMTWFDNLIHPVSLVPYLMGLGGLGLMAWRRKKADKYLLLWFAVVYVIFTLIPNREWRYVTIAFPVLAIAAACFLTASYGKLHELWKNAGQSLTRRWGSKVLAVVLVSLTVAGGFLSCADAYNWVNQTKVSVPIEQAVNYAAQNLTGNQSVAVACPLNRFNQYMVRYYLNVKDPSFDFSKAWQYPAEAVDAYTPDFNISDFTLLCQQHDAKYVLLYESSQKPYFNTNLTAQTIYNNLKEVGGFTLEGAFGLEPDRVFVFSVLEVTQPLAK